MVPHSSLFYVSYIIVSNAPALSVSLPQQLTDITVLVCSHQQAMVQTPEGELIALPLNQVATVVQQKPLLVCYRPMVMRRLQGLLPEEQLAQSLDILELFAFVRPAQFCLPSPKGIAQALGLPLPAQLDDEATSLYEAALTLLEQAHGQQNLHTPRLTAYGIKVGWGWGPLLWQAVKPQDPIAQIEVQETAERGLSIFEQLPEWGDEGGISQPGSQPVDPQAALERLQLLRPAQGEERPEQQAYTAGVCHAFNPREHELQPQIVLAEAGTGVGKTLGYVAPASLWAEANGAPVWISTFTRTLQRQIERELHRLTPLTEGPSPYVVRKGRENYLCLLNYDDRCHMRFADPRSQIALVLVARWIMATRNGDIMGGDFPGWLFDILGNNSLNELTIKRGECLFAACPHYRRCFVEHSIRQAESADLVVANHALAVLQTARGMADPGELNGVNPSRFIFDEGHHLFDAADKVYTMQLTGWEAYELRRWLIGDESSARGKRKRSLATKIIDLELGDGMLMTYLQEVTLAARVLPGSGWLQRQKDEAPYGALETFLAKVRQQVYARTTRGHNHYSIECESHPMVEGMDEVASALREKLIALHGPLQQLHQRLNQQLSDQADTLDTETRRRIMLFCQSLEVQALLPISSWQSMLDALVTGQTPEAFIDRMILERKFGQDHDMGLARHFIDPMQPFAKALQTQAHGMVVTSATLRDSTDNLEHDWQIAEQRGGVTPLNITPHRLEVASPFDYASQSKILVVGDVNKNDINQVASAYRALFLAAGGGALGLFTAIARLKSSYQHLAPALEAEGLPLYAQHIDPIGVNTLIDLFRAEEDACLLGTDAVRDGIDVPGRSLRLLVFDRLPWPRPDLCHKARRAAFGGRRYDDMLVRFKLRQAFGRLIRRKDDQGVFVILDPALPSRLKSAFPAEAPIEAVGLAEAVQIVGTFLTPNNDAFEHE